MCCLGAFVYSFRDHCTYPEWWVVDRLRGCVFAYVCEVSAHGGYGHPDVHSELHERAHPLSVADAAPRNVRQRTRNGSATSSRRVNPCPGRPETPGRKYPPEGSSAPWNNQVSIRTWSWNHSTCRRLGAAAPTWACRWGAQWADTPRLDASANAAALNQTVTPPQRVTSIWRQSTASAANMCPK